MKLTGTDELQDDLMEVTTMEKEKQKAFATVAERFLGVLTAAKRQSWTQVKR